MRRAVSSGAWWLSPNAAAVVALAPALVAVFICAHQLTLHGVLHGVVIGNESPNLPSSIALTRGALPYDNFPLAQPPGMVVLMLPFAWLSHFVASSVAMSLARVATAITTVVAVYLAGFAARFYGVPATLLAGVFTAVYPLQLFSTAGVTVGPYVLVFTLAGIGFAFQEGRLASRARLLLAGLCLGFACTLKPWAVIPALVFAVCVLAVSSTERGKLGPAAAGLGISIAVPSIVFLLAAPAVFWRDVVLAELPGNGTMTVGSKFAAVLGLATNGAARIAQPGNLAVGIAVTVMVVVGLVAIGGGGSSLPYDWFIAATAVLVMGAVFLPGRMAPTYGQFAFPIIAIAVAVTTLRLLTFGAAALSGRRGDSLATLASAVAVLLVGCAVVVAAVGAPAVGGFGARYADAHGIVDTGRISRGVPAPDCAVSNNAMLLVAANRFNADGVLCPVVTDATGLVAIERGHGGAAAVQAQWVQWLIESRYALLVHPTSDVPLRGRSFAHYFYRTFSPLERTPLFALWARPSA